MKKQLNTIVLAGLISAILLPYAYCAQNPAGQEAAGKQANLKKFLRKFLKDYHYDYQATRYFASFVNLQDEGGQQVIVYFTDQHSCGSGGCTTLILAPQGPSYRVVTSISIAWPPIRVLRSQSNGWHDISVWVQGGGIQPGYEAKLSFNGQKYPSNPTVPPARRLKRKVSGTVVVFRGVEGVPLDE